VVRLKTNKKGVIIKKPLEILIQLILISFAAIVLMAFVGKLSDNTVFRQQMMDREAAIIAPTAITAPTAAAVQLIPPDPRMDKFVYSYEDSKSVVSVKGQKIHYPTTKIRSTTYQGQIAFLNDDSFGAQESIPDNPYSTRCGEQQVETFAIRLDAGKSDSIQSTIPDDVLKSMLASVPGKFARFLQPRTMNQLFLEHNERKDIIQGADANILSIQFEDVKKPVVYYSTDDNGLSRKLACSMANHLSKKIRVAAIPFNPDFEKPESNKLLLGQKTGVQVVLPNNLDFIKKENGEKTKQEILAQMLWSGLGRYFS